MEFKEVVITVLMLAGMIVGALVSAGAFIAQDVTFGILFGVGSLFCAFCLGFITLYVVAGWLDY
jgi:hypothetical protein